jgi:hypothetical protein
METALKGLEKAIVTGRLKDRNKMERRRGKIQARHPQVNDLYDLALRDTVDGVRLFWQMKEDRKNWRQAREGLICCAPISRRKRRKSCGRSTCS